MAKSGQRNVFNGLQAGAITFGANSTANGNVYAGDAGQPDPQSDRNSALLIVVAADVERVAFMDQMRGTSNATVPRRHLRHHTVYELGTVRATDILLAQVGQGTETPDAAGASAVSLIHDLQPDHLILAGICYGLKDEDQSRPQLLGDVVVANQLRLIAHRKVTQPDDGAVVNAWRGGEVHPSAMLLDRFRSAGCDWRSSAAVHIGPVLSESVLVNSREYREALRRAHPDAVAGEMEGSGIYAAAQRSKVDWGLVKGICDWGHGKTDDHQRIAADNAASFVLHTVAVGGLDLVPPTGSG